MSNGGRRGRSALQMGLAPVLVALLIAAGCRRGTEPPRVAATPPPRAPVTGFPDTPAGRAVSAHVQAARAVGPNVGVAFQASLQELQGHGGEAVNVLVTSYRSANPADYGQRGLLVEILAELERAEALPALIEIAQSPVLKQSALPDEALSPFVEESVIRAVAIRGIGVLVPADRQAENALVALLKSDAAPVRDAAARALWSASARIDDPNRRAGIRKLVPVELQLDPETKLGPVSPPGADPPLQPAN